MQTDTILTVLTLSNSRECSLVGYVDAPAICIQYILNLNHPINKPSPALLNVRDPNYKIYQCWPWAVVGFHWFPRIPPFKNGSLIIFPFAIRSVYSNRTVSIIITGFRYTLIEQSLLTV